MKKEPLLFEIISAHISETDGSEKKYVLYTLRVRHVSKREDSLPATIERRYTDFLKLYTGLSNEFPDLMSSVTFPKKALVGNFDNKLITARSMAFELLLKHVVANDKLQSSQYLLNFLQETELIKVKQYISTKQHAFAIPLLENNFTLLNNVYTDRSPPVLLALCRLLGCSCSLPGSPHADKWADLALHRFEGVSDSDLLALYVPLLHVCVKVWWQNGRDKSMIEQRLFDMKRQGINCSDNLTLLEAATQVEMKIMEL